MRFIIVLFDYAVIAFLLSGIPMLEALGLFSVSIETILFVMVIIGVLLGAETKGRKISLLSKVNITCVVLVTTGAVIVLGHPILAGFYLLSVGFLVYSED